MIERIENDGGYVLDHRHAAMDQVAGVALAAEKGFRKIAVTIALPADAEKIRRIHPETLIFAVHVTGLTPADAEVSTAADLITACASKTIREVAAGKAPGRYRHPYLRDDEERKRTDNGEDPSE